MATILFGGSFDPPHNGHMRIAQAALEDVKEARLLFIPTKISRWKEPNESEEDRLAMLQAALSECNEPRFFLETYEIAKPEGISYTIDTILHFKETLGNEKLYFLLGADSVNTFDRWKEAERIASLSQILYSERPGFTLSKENIKRFHMMPLSKNESGPVSSSDIRSLRSVDAPESVLRYIEAHELYYIKRIKEQIGPKRLAHSIRVARLSERIVECNGLLALKGKGYIAGLLHDLGKYLEEEEGKRIASKEFPSLSFEGIPAYAIHEYSGAALAKERFGIEDQDILDAIACHCSGKEKMSPLAKILYAADKIEPGRGYDSSPYIKCCLHDFEKGFKEVLKVNEEYLKEKGEDPRKNKESQKCFRYYLGE